MKMLNKILYFLFIILIKNTYADSPSLPPHDYVICSESVHYCGFVSANNQLVSIFRILPGYSTIEYTIPGFLQLSAISDDGKKLVMVQPIIMADHFNDQPVFKLWVNGIVKKNIFIKDILIDKEPLKTTSGYSWGQPLGFSGKNAFILQIYDGSKFAVNLEDDQ